jgi:hypothetical protein
VSSIKRKPQAEGRFLPVPPSYRHEPVFPDNHDKPAVEKLVFADPTIGVHRSFPPSVALPQLQRRTEFPSLRMAQGNLFVVNLIRLVKLSENLCRLDFSQRRLFEKTAEGKGVLSAEKKAKTAVR